VFVSHRRSRPLLAAIGGKKVVVSRVVGVLRLRQRRAGRRVPDRPRSIPFCSNVHCDTLSAEFGGPEDVWFPVVNCCFDDVRSWIVRDAGNLPSDGINDFTVAIFSRREFRPVAQHHLLGPR